jgi:hypothetical protein
VATIFHAPCCRPCLQCETYRDLHFSRSNLTKCVTQCFLLEGFKSCHPTPILQFVSPKTRILLIRYTPNSATGGHKIECRSRRQLRSRSSPQLTPNIDRLGLSWTPGLAPICSGRLTVDREKTIGEFRQLLYPSRKGHAVTFPPIFFATTTRFRTSPRSALG